MEGREVIVLASESHSTYGCDRVVLAGDHVIVQGKPRAGYPKGTLTRVPPDEILNAISVDVFLDAARQLERLREQQL
jgi:hypothetical protein